MSAQERIYEALTILIALGLPRGQRNERTALCLLALLDLDPYKPWSAATRPMIGITPIMEWASTNYGKDYAPNTRETFRRQSMHQFVDAGLALYNPDKPSRSVNSPSAVYQIAPEAFALLCSFGTPEWAENLAAYLASHESLAARYAMERNLPQIPVQLSNGQAIVLSPGAHSELITAVIQQFAPRFAPHSVLIYAGDTGSKWGYFDKDRLTALGVEVDSHGKMPDVVIHDVKRNWLMLIEAVTSHGPVDGKRHHELAKLFAHANAGLVYVTAFPTRALMAKYLPEIAWETEVWVSEAPTHLIHFDGERFLGPYK